MSGLLVPVDDVTDYYEFTIPPDLVGVNLRVDILNHTFSTLLAVFAPDCKFNVVPEENEGGVPPGHDPNNPGKGHQKCKGEGHLDHPECTAADGERIDEDTVGFTPLRSATFKVRLVLNVTVEPPAPGPVPVVCHSICIPPLNDNAGYDLGTFKGDH